MVLEHRDALVALADALCMNDELSGDDVSRIVTASLACLTAVADASRPAGAADAPPSSTNMSARVRSVWVERHTSIAWASGSTTAGSVTVVRHVGSAARSKHSHDPSPNWT